MMKYSLTVFYDYLCPFSHRIRKWLEKVEQSGQVELDIKWRALSLEQINQKQGENFKIWEHPEYGSRGILALVAAKAALRQGELLFKRFHGLVFQAYHDQGKDISQRAVLMKAASEAGLDLQILAKDLDLQENLTAIDDDYKEARKSYNLFGVPSIIFENDEPLFVKIGSVPETEAESLTLLNYIMPMGLGMPYLLELKRP